MCIVADRESQEKSSMKTYFDKSAKEKQFETGDLVLVRKPGKITKLSGAWDSPYRVLARTSPVNYQIELSGRGKSKIVHANLLNRWHMPSEKVAHYIAWPKRTVI